MFNHYCKTCGKLLHGDEIALYRKLVDRRASEYLCLSCYAEHVQTDVSNLQSLIDFYHRTGICSLFAKYETSTP